MEKPFHLWKNWFRQFPVTWLLNNAKHFLVNSSFYGKTVPFMEKLISPIPCNMAAE